MPKKRTRRRKSSERKLYTLTEVSKKANISMPTLQRYKKLYQDRIPSVGEGRTQRYPEESLKVFAELKKENLARRGRPRKGGARRKKATARKRSASRRGGKAEGLITLSEVGRRTGISYPTLLRYVRLHLDQIPHRGTGRTRRYPSEAVEVFARLRSQSRRGRKPAAAGSRQGVVVNRTLESRLRRLETAHSQLAKELRGVIKTLRKPLQVTIRTR